MDENDKEEIWQLLFFGLFGLEVWLFLVPLPFSYPFAWIIGWGIISFGSFALFLFRKIPCNKTRLTILSALLLMHFAAGVYGFARKSEYQPKEREVAIGHFVKKDGNEFVYNIRRSDGKYDVVRVEVDHEYRTNNSAYFQQIRKVVLLRTNPGKIIEWEPSLKQIKDFKYAVKYTTTLDDELIGVNSFDFAKDHPRIYFENFGIDVVYKAKIKYIENNYCTVVYKNIFGNQNEVYFKCNPSKIKDADSILISKKIKPDTTFTPVYFGLIEEYPAFNHICYSFPDTLLNAEMLNKNIPQFNDYIFNSSANNANNKFFASIGYFLRMNVYPGGNGSTNYSPIYLLRDLDGNSLEIEIDTLLSTSAEMEYNDSICLIDAYRKKILKWRLSESDFEKYKYPIQIMYGGIEIGNNSYGYAKNEPEKFIKNYDVTMCFLANASYSLKDGINKCHISGKDNYGQKFDDTILITQSFHNYSQLIVYKKEGTYYPAEPQFQTDFYFEKIKDSFGYLFKDTILTKQELIEDIPMLIKKMR